VGDYRITIDAVGGHGCARETKSGQRPYRCRRDDCVDCQVARFVEQLKQRGNSISQSKIEHWPAERFGGLEPNPNPGPIDVTKPRADGFLEEVRLGSFGDTPYQAHANDTASA